MKNVVSVLLLLALPFAVQAAESVDELAPLVGEWEGGGWIQRGPERASFTSHESVRHVLDRTALLVEGQHYMERDGEKIPVHNALALIRRAAGGDYTMHSWLSDGRDTEGWARWRDGEFQWGFTLPNGSREVRYRIRVEDDRWTEAGETRIADGEWMTFFGMELDRTGE